MSQEEKEYIIVPAPSTITAFHRIRKVDGRIEFNANYIHLLSEAEIEAILLWCKQRIEDYDVPKELIDEWAFESCKKKGLENALITAMVKQSRVDNTSEYSDRLEHLIESAGVKKIKVKY